jgi:hypothetical protein
MNLENLGLVELNAQDAESTNGGNGVHGGGTGLVSNQGLGRATGELIHAVGDFLRGFFIG